MSIIIKVGIIAVWAMIIIIGEIIVFSIKKRKFIKGEPTVGLIIRRDFTKESAINSEEFNSDMANDTNLGH